MHYHQNLVDLIQISIKNLFTEYCLSETFSPKCGKDQVVIIDHGMYGRMMIGRCVKDDYGMGTIGCSVDVKNTLMGKCSGRRTCEIEIPFPKYDNQLTCLKEMRPYLEASYSCLKGMVLRLVYRVINIKLVTILKLGIYVPYCYSNIILTS